MVAALARTGPGPSTAAVLQRRRLLSRIALRSDVENIQLDVESTSTYTKLFADQAIFSPECRGEEAIRSLGQRGLYFYGILLTEIQSEISTYILV